MLHYEQYGKGEPVLVLLHGFCENNTCFDRQVFFLKDHVSLVCIDLPGFGKSEVINDLTVDIAATAVKEVLDHLQVQQCIMMGHSMGGYVALAFAALYPSYLIAIGLIHSTPLADSPERIEKRKQVVAFIRENGKAAYLKNFIPTLFHDPVKDPEIVLRFIKQGIEASEEGIVQAVFMMMQRPDRTALLKVLTIPVFFAIGKHDQLIPEKDIFSFVSLCKEAEVVYLEQAAHMGMVESDIGLNHSILKFCERVVGNTNTIKP